MNYDSVLSSFQTCMKEIGNALRNLLGTSKKYKFTEIADAINSCDLDGIYNEGYEAGYNTGYAAKRISLNMNITWQDDGDADIVIKKSDGTTVASFVALDPGRVHNKSFTVS